MIQLQRILVTGGAGFIGSHTVQLLLQQQKEVIVLDNLSSGNLSHLDLSNPLLEFIEGDVLEFPLLEEIMEKCDAVLHLAAIASVPLSFEDPVYTMQVNTQGVLHVLQAARKIARPIRIVWASSASVYGDGLPLPLQDQLQLNVAATSPYALQKRQAEQAAELFGRLFNIPSLALRYFNVYGDRQTVHSSYSGVITRFMHAYSHNQPLTIYGDGHQSRDFIAVQDVARANVLALHHDVAGVINIGTGLAHDLLTLVQLIEQTGGKKAQIEYQPMRPGDIQFSFAAVKKAKELIDFNAEITFEAGIKHFLNSLY